MGLDPDDMAPEGDAVTSVYVERAPLYLSMLDMAAAGLDSAAMAVRHFSWDGTTDPTKAQAIVDSHLRRAAWMRDVGYRQLLRGLPKS